MAMPMQARRYLRADDTQDITRRRANAEARLRITPRRA